MVFDRKELSLNQRYSASFETGISKFEAVVEGSLEISYRVPSLTASLRFNLFQSSPVLYDGDPQPPRRDGLLPH